MDYQQAIEYIENLTSLEQKQPSPPSLKRMESFLAFYNSPHHAFKAFHVGGTNGKGSTVAILDAILRQGKLKIGRFTGPHLLRLNERFHINGQPITDDQFARGVQDLKAKSENFSLLNTDLGQLSWFEFITALAFFYFADNNVDIAAIEVGLGGRFDATNVLQNLFASGVTNIALDHQNILGSTIETIAMEKAGIIKANVPIVTAACEPALTVISNRANELGAQLIVCDNTKLPNNCEPTAIRQSLESFKNNFYRRGIYQYQNACLALNMMQVAKLLASESTTYKMDSADHQITLDQALEATQNFYWPGRFQILKSNQLILDGAHNPAGIQALRESLDHLLPGHQFHFIFGCYSDKDGLTMLKNLLHNGDKLYLAAPSGKRRSFSLSTLAGLAQKHNISVTTHASISEAYSFASKNRKTHEFIVATGSFSILKDLVQDLGWQSVEDGID